MPPSSGRVSVRRASIGGVSSGSGNFWDRGNFLSDAVAREPEVFTAPADRREALEARGGVAAPVREVVLRLRFAPFGVRAAFPRLAAMDHRPETVIRIGGPCSDYRVRGATSSSPQHASRPARLLPPVPDLQRALCIGVPRRGGTSQPRRDCAVRSL